MRFEKTYRKKEKFFAIFRRAQTANGFLRDLSIRVRSVGYVGGFISGTAREFRDIGFVGEEGFFTRQSSVRVVLGQQVGNGLASERGHAPGRGVFMVPMAYVKNFAQPFGPVTLAHEVLRQRDGVGSGLAEIRAQIIDA